MNKRRFLFLLAWLFPLSLSGQSLQLADSLFKKGRFYDEQGKMRQSAFYYREAYNVYREHQDTTGWLKAGKEYASALVYRSNNGRAMELYKMLLEVKHRANDVYNRGDILNSMGWSSRRIGKLDQALSYYQKSLPLALESRDSLLIAVVFNNIGVVYFKKGNYPGSLDYYRKSLPYYKGLGSLTSFARTLANIGHIYKELSVYGKALDYYRRSLIIRSQLENVNQLAGIHDLIAGVQFELGNYNQSLTALQKSLEYRREAEVPQATASTLNDIGLLYKNLGQYDKALDYYQQSLVIGKKTSGPASIAITTRNIAMVLWQQEKYEQASELYKKALTLKRRINNSYDIALSLQDLIRMELQSGNYYLARQYAGELKAIGDSTNSNDILADVYTWLGEIEKRQENFQQSLAHYKKAYVYSRFLSHSEQITPLKNIAEAFHRLNSDKAITFGQKAVAIIEESRTKAGALSELKSGYFSRHADFYIQLASWVLNYRQDKAEAFRLVELAKARSLSDELAKAAQDIAERLPEEVRIERNQKRHHINRLYSELEAAENSEQHASIQQKIRVAELSYAAYESSLYAEYPELRRFKSPEPLSLGEARVLAGEGTALLEYAVTDNQLIMFLISQNEVRVEQFSMSDDQGLEAELTARVSAFRSAVLAHASETVLQRRSSDLYNVLIEPFEDDLKKYSNLIIVPDGALSYLPFEALMQGGHYLIENYSIKYVPSLTSLTLLDSYASIEDKKLLAIAGSQFSQNELGTFRKSSLAALPSTLIEVDSIASHFKRPSVLTNREVSEGTVKKLLNRNDYQFIHFATHGVIDEERPWRSGLALSIKGKLTASSTEDGMLRSSEIFGLRLNTEMVVLSACNTGLGDVVSGEGILGMQRAFFFAGASTVVVSLWNVYDRSTAFLMNQFYDFILKNTGDEDWVDSLLRWVGWDESIPFGQKATAMRKAKLQMINHPLYNHPVYWAPFIVVGR
ncbi:MAG TPA: CHAT domain-containing tetratricopeptide repeat protein [Balneolaceae bacterium]